MQNYLKRPFILFLAFAALLVGWQTVANNAIFNGVGVPFVGIILIVAVLTYKLVTNKEVRHRILDLFALACAFVVLELPVYFVQQFGLGNAGTCHGFNVYQNVLSVLGLIYLIYVVFRAIYEAKGLNCSFIEIVLGNKKPVKKVKQAKEFTNGSLEAKPNQKKEATDVNAQNDNVENTAQPSQPEEENLENAPVSNSASEAEGEE